MLKQKTFAAFCVVVMMVGLLYVFLLGSKSAETLNQLDPDIHPDVLVIMIDDLNDWVGILGGHPQAKTPNIDALANKSVTFLNAHAPAPLCSPSRSALLTGLRPSSSGIYNNHSDWRSLSLPFSITSLPKFFRENGYETYGAGKVFHAHTFTEEGYKGNNDPDAWTMFYPSVDQQMPLEQAPDHIPVNGNPIVKDFDWGVIKVKDQKMADTKVVDWISEKMTEERTVPRMFFAGIYRPHLPWYVPQKYFDLHPLDQIILPEIIEGDLADVPKTATLPFLEMSEHPPMALHDWVADSQKWKEGVQAYLASMSFADEQVGQLIKTLKDAGRFENTIIVIMSDHGFHLGEKERWRKQTLWSESTRVLLSIKPNSRIKVNPSITEPVSLMDIYPTVSELAKLDAPDYVEGHSLVPLVTGEGVFDGPGAALTTNGYKNHSVVTERYRYTRYSNGSQELYDLTKDPNEWTNLAMNENSKPIISELKQHIPTENSRPAQ